MVRMRDFDIGVRYGPKKTGKVYRKVCRNVPYGGVWEFPIERGKLRPGVPMLCYASRTGTARNLFLMWKAGWRLLVSAGGVWRTEGFPSCGNNGVWASTQQNLPFQEEQYERFLEKMASEGWKPDFLILPDIIADGRRSLELSIRWMNRCASASDLVLIPVQDGIEPEDLEHLVNERVGIFLGGSTEWKIKEMGKWGAFCRRKRCWYHVGRVNTGERFRAALDAGADSTDGSGGTKFALAIPKMDAARLSADLISAHQPWMEIAA